MESKGVDSLMRCDLISCWDVGKDLAGSVGEDPFESQVTAEAEVEKGSTDMEPNFSATASAETSFLT